MNLLRCVAIVRRRDSIAMHYTFHRISAAYLLLRSPVFYNPPFNASATAAGAHAQAAAVDSVRLAKLCLLCSGIRPLDWSNASFENRLPSVWMKP